MQTWQLQKAKSHFSELVELTLKDGPQMVTRRGKEAVVLVAAHDYRRLSGQMPKLMDWLLNAPRGEQLNIKRPSGRIRDISL